jgi:hypothetical protein
VTANIEPGSPFDGASVNTTSCQLRNGASIIGSATDRRFISEDDLVELSLSMKGGALVSAGGGEVSLWCQPQIVAGVTQAQMMIVQVGGFS